MRFGILAGYVQQGLDKPVLASNDRRVRLEASYCGDLSDCLVHKADIVLGTGQPVGDLSFASAQFDGANLRPDTARPCLYTLGALLREACRYVGHVVRRRLVLRVGEMEHRERLLNN